MPDHSPLAIANEFLRRCAESVWPAQMKIQKLAYIAHGWNLAINDSALIDEAPEAWDNGPVFRGIWKHVRDHGYRGENCILIDPKSKSEFEAELSAGEQAVVEHVWRRYGHMDAKELSDLTHEPDTPWSEAYLQRGRNAHLSNDRIKEHYTNIAITSRG